MRGSDREWLARLEATERAALLARLDADGAARLGWDWRFQARPTQLPPPGDWRVWLMMAGRGFGKTRAGAEWVRGIAEADPAARIALVGATLGEARAVMVEGVSGVLSVAPWWARPDYAPALRRLTWPNGAVAMLFGAAEPESLRGPQFSHGWADEIAKWASGAAAWDNLMMGLRIGDAPRVLATTTPRPVPLVRRLVAADGVVVTGGRTADNAANLAPGFVAAMAAAYGGTRLGRQELDGELIAEVEGALWTRDLIERCRVAHVPGVLRRVVVAVDPPASAEGDACGIVVAGLGGDGRAYVIADASV
ncbi:MAG: terminase family protein, partial [Sphingobium sp.]